MSIYRTFEKSIGRLRIRVSQPSPRWFDIQHLDRDEAIDGLQIEEMRDLRYAIDRILALAEEDDKLHGPPTG